MFLIGFMGAGKTTLGRALAATSSSGLPDGEVTYVDLDELVEQHEKMSVSDIFRLKGEAEFRRLESQLLRETAATGNVVVGCGGGTPCHSDNMEWMNAHGVTVLLEASRPVLLRRLLAAQQKRPLLAGMAPGEVEAFIDAKLREREPFYSLAQERFNSDYLESADEIAQSCRDFQRIFDLT